MTGVLSAPSVAVRRWNRRFPPSSPKPARRVSAGVAVIGRTIGQYKIIDKLGEGGMGAVYKAEDTTLQRLVALKTLSRHLSSDKDARERFIREAQAASGLNHANITTIHELLEEEDEYFICMEYVEGKTIRDMVEGGRVSIKKAIDIIQQAAEALETAHSKGILHRDIKSANIMVTMEGQVKLMDFGLAHLEERSQLTRTGTTMGTLAYSSPEQISGRTVDRRSEIFSLGVVFYELLTGGLPFKASSEAEIIFSIINNEPEKLSELREDVPELLETLVSRMMEKDSELRYQNCGELLDDLKAIRSDYETSTVSISTRLQSKPGIRKKKILIGAAAGAIVVLGILSLLIGVFSPEEDDIPRIAVLPFDNLDSADREFFADGLTDDIISRLSALQGLRPIDRRSAMQYKGTDKSPREIGRELDVEYILDGTTRWQILEGGKSLVRITPRLIQVSDGTEIWSEQYDEDYADIFRIQSYVATRVVQHLNIELLEPERKALNSRPTESSEAYLAYLGGREYAAKSASLANCNEAVRLFRETVNLDPDFAWAYGELSKVHSRIYHWGYDRSDRRREMAKQSAERALQISPDSPEVHRSLGYFYYWTYKDYDRALEEFSIAGKALPNDTDVMAGTAAILRRLSRVDEALAIQKKAFQLNTRDADAAMDISITYQGLRLFEEAESYCDLSIELAPDQVLPYVHKALNVVAKGGSIEEARTVLSEAPQVDDSYLVYAWFQIEIAEGNYQSAMEVLSATSFEVVATHTLLYPISLMKAQLYHLMGRPELSRIEAEEARIVLERLVEISSDDPRLRSALGLAYAYLGLAEEAIREGVLVAEELCPISFDALRGQEFIRTLAWIYVIVGEYDSAVDQLNVLLTNPGPTSVAILESSPDWRPLDGHPRFQQLLRKFR